MSKVQKPQVIRPIGKPLTEEEKKQKAALFIAQKREQFAKDILNGLCHNPAAISICTDREQGISGDLKTRVTNGDQLVDASIAMADRLIEKLYIPEEEKAE